MVPRNALGILWMLILTPLVVTVALTVSWSTPGVGGVVGVGVVGQPLLAQQVGDATLYKAHVHLANYGTAPVAVVEDGVVVRGTVCRLARTVLEPGASRALVALCRFDSPLVEHAVDGLVVTDLGTLVTGFAVVNVVPEVPRL
jgi:hypothetical protein